MEEKYTIISGSLEEVYELVNLRMSEGWTPFGGISHAMAIKNPNDPYEYEVLETFSQAMVRT